MVAIEVFLTSPNNEDIITWTNALYVVHNVWNIAVGLSHLNGRKMIPG